MLTHNDGRKEIAIGHLIYILLYQNNLDDLKHTMLSLSYDIENIFLRLCFHKFTYILPENISILLSGVLYEESIRIACSLSPMYIKF